MQPPAWVIRDGKIQSIDADNVVPRDILVLKRGVLVPADGRIIEANRLRLNEAVLTGESMPVSKQADALFGPETPVAERLNMVYRGTLVTGGSGLAVALTTGKSTELGRIHGLIQISEPQRLRWRASLIGPPDRRDQRLRLQSLFWSGFCEATDYWISSKALFHWRLPPSPRDCRPSRPRRWPWAFEICAAIPS